MTAIQVTWHIGSMREGDTRSTISTSTVEFSSYAADFAEVLRGVDLVMEVTIRDNNLYAKLDIGDQHSRVMPWENHPTPTTAGKWSEAFHRIDAEAKKVVDVAHQLLASMVGNIDPEPIAIYDRAAKPASIVGTTVITQAY